MKSTRTPNPVLSLVFWMLPAGAVKNMVLRLLGNEIGRGADLGPNLVLRCGRFSCGAGSSIGAFNVFRNLAAVELGDHAFIGGFNQVTAAPAYQRIDRDAGRLVLAAGAGIVNRHYLDCSGGIRLGRMAMLAGVRSIFQSHELDLRHNRATAAPIAVGEFTFTGTRVLVLAGASVPARSIVAAGSVWVRGSDPARPGLHAGNPARWIKPVADWEWMSRRDVHTPVPEGVVP